MIWHKSTTGDCFAIEGDFIVQAHHVEDFGWCFTLEKDTVGSPVKVIDYGNEYDTQDDAIEAAEDAYFMEVLGLSPHPTFEGED